MVAKAYEKVTLVNVSDTQIRANLPYQNGTVFVETSLKAPKTIIDAIREKNLIGKAVNMIVGDKNVLMIDWPGENEDPDFAEKRRTTQTPASIAELPPTPEEVTMTPDQTENMTAEEKKLFKIFGCIPNKAAKTSLRPQAPETPQQIAPIPKEAITSPTMPKTPERDPAPKTYSTGNLTVNVQTSPGVKPISKTPAGLDKEDRISFLSIMKCATEVVAANPNKSDNAWAEGTKVLLLTEFMHNATCRKFLTGQSITEILEINNE